MAARDKALEQFVKHLALPHNQEMHLPSGSYVMCETGNWNILNFNGFNRFERLVGRMHSLREIRLIHERLLEEVRMWEQLSMCSRSMRMHLAEASSESSWFGGTRLAYDVIQYRMRKEEEIRFKFRPDYEERVWAALGGEDVRRRAEAAALRMIRHELESESESEDLSESESSSWSLGDGA